MAKAKKAVNKSKKKPIEQYAHKGKQRANNPPVGLVTPQLTCHADAQSPTICETSST
jgi:hypothetical protein